MARLPGSVHGVVVQINTLALASAPCAGEVTGNFTHTVSEV